MFKPPSPLPPYSQLSESPNSFFAKLLVPATPPVEQEPNAELTPQLLELPPFGTLVTPEPATRPQRKRTTVKKETDSDEEFNPLNKRAKFPPNEIPEATNEYMAEEERRREEKLARNRVSAQLSRLRKKQEVDVLEEKNKVLKQQHKTDQMIQAQLLAQQREDQALIASLRQQHAPLTEKIERLKGKKRVLAQQNLLFFQLLEPLIASTIQTNDEVIATSTTPRIGE